MVEAAAPVHYRVEAANRKRHVWAVELHIAQPAARQRVSLPVWIPGSYLVRDFARHLNRLSARRGKTLLPVTQIDKCTWEVAANPAAALTLRYEVYAFDPSVRAAWLDEERGFFNGTSLLLRVHGQEHGAHHISVAPPADAPGWQLATAMHAVAADARGFGTYRADDYDELVDHPFALGAFWSARFTARGRPHRLVVFGAPPAFDGKRLVHDTRAICQTHIRFWHGRARPDKREYVFMLNAARGGYGGIEHRASCALECARADLPQIDPAIGAPPDASKYKTLLGVISHEYFHAWNVKRIKPAAFAPYDYTRENHTELLWFFEGFTSYYDDLLLRRAGLIDDGDYLRRITRSINQVLQAPGRRAQSVAQASFDAWTRYYRPSENTPNSTISYYSKGSLIALCLDLTLRAEGRATLDDVMRLLWQRFHDQPLAEGDIAAALAACGGRPFERELAAWVHGTDALPLEPLLRTQGVAIHKDRAPMAQALGLRVEEDRGVVVRVVLDGGAGAAAGLAAGDEWLGIEVPADGKSGNASAWRMQTLGEITLFAGGARTVTAIIARDQRLLRLPLTLPRTSTTWRLLRPAADGTEHTWPANGREPALAGA